MHHIQTRNQPASSLVIIIIKVVHRQSKVSRKYVVKNALLTALAARSAALTSSLYICIDLDDVSALTSYGLPVSCRESLYFSVCHQFGQLQLDYSMLLAIDVLQDVQFYGNHGIAS